jgi:hypothetical protein
MKGFLKRVAIDRATGNRPSSARSTVAAVVVGAAASVVTYRVLRHQEDKR